MSECKPLPCERYISTRNGSLGLKLCSTVKASSSASCRPHPPYPPLPPPPLRSRSAARSHGLSHAGSPGGSTVAQPKRLRGGLEWFQGIPAGKRVASALPAARPVRPRPLPRLGPLRPPPHGAAPGSRPHGGCPLDVAHRVHTRRTLLPGMGRPWRDGTGRLTPSISRDAAAGIRSGLPPPAYRLPRLRLLSRTANLWRCAMCASMHRARFFPRQCAHLAPRVGLDVRGIEEKFKSESVIPV